MLFSRRLFSHFRWAASKLEHNSEGVLVQALALMQRRFPFLFLPLLGMALASCVSQASQIDPLAADRPKGPVRPAPYEPAQGVYLGAAIDTSNVQGDATKSLGAQMSQFNRDAGKNQALYLHFLQFPNAKGEFGDWENDANGWISAAQFSNAAQSVGATPILTLEPFKPKVFLDWKPGSPAYEATQKFAQSAGKWGKPVFIRFAHEMNGSWYPWGEWIDYNENQVKEPDEETGFLAAQYVTAYRNVASMFRKYAPNAALIWCPNSGLMGGPRRDPFRAWYPGDDVVDWVGLDVYERGFFLPQPGAKLWGGQFAQNLNFDTSDDTSTTPNESVNFYLVYGATKRKPIIICETGATLSFRTDLALKDRAQMTRDWKIGYWNPSEYGWIQNVYGTTKYAGQKFLNPLDTNFPLIKAIVWFQIAKKETVPARKPDGTVIHFDKQWTDYRIGGGVEPGKRSIYGQQELDVYRALTANSYFLSGVENKNVPVASGKNKKNSWMAKSGTVTAKG